MELEKLDHVATANEVTADPAKCLTKGSDQQVDIRWSQPEVIQSSSTSFTEYAYGVSIVQQQQGAVFFSQRNEIR